MQRTSCSFSIFCIVFSTSSNTEAGTAILEYALDQLARNDRWNSLYATDGRRSRTQRPIEDRRRTRLAAMSKKIRNPKFSFVPLAQRIHKVRRMFFAYFTLLAAMDMSLAICAPLE
jgi:hypothetical protein